ncbi:hypothetical protein LPJ70_005724, partial [Coemansia sp. RSA 2708]
LCRRRCSATPCCCSSRPPTSAPSRCASCTGTFRASPSRRASTRASRTPRPPSRSLNPMPCASPPTVAWKACSTTSTLWAPACRGNCPIKNF